MGEEKTPPSMEPFEGILLVDKPAGKTSFSLVASLRKRLGVKKIGHAGTLDPFATGVMVMLIGKNFTRLSDQFLVQDKEYQAELHLGKSTDTYDCEGTITQTSDHIPTLEEIQETVALFQGDIEQIPPMFSAKKVNGQKLYELARKGKSIERLPVKIHVQIEILSYQYPHLTIRVACSKGTYIRSLAHDIGQTLHCGAHLSALKRLRSGIFRIEECIDGALLNSTEFDRKTCYQSLLTHMVNHVK
jgi:tRNA pseudouridine55 synthase